jgi:hypothetical protein
VEIRLGTGAHVVVTCHFMIFSAEATALGRVGARRLRWLVGNAISQIDGLDGRRFRSLWFRVDSTSEAKCGWDKVKEGCGPQPLARGNRAAALWT